jgi:hypothetical protein
MNEEESTRNLRIIERERERRTRRLRYTGDQGHPAYTYKKPTNQPAITTTKKPPSLK